MTQEMQAATPTNGHSTSQEVLVLRDASFLDQPRTAMTPIPLSKLVRTAFVSLVVIAVCAAASIGYAMTKPVIRGGVVDIIYEPSASASSSVQLDRELATQQVIVRGRSVLEPVAQREHMTVDKLEQATDVSVLPGTEVLHVTVADRSAPRARRIAQEIADTYVGQSTGTTGQSLNAQLTSLRAQLTTAQTAATDAYSDSNARATAAAHADDLVHQITSVQARLAALPPAGNLHGTPRTLDAASVLPSPLYPKPLRAGSFGIVIGMFIAGAMALALLRRRGD